ncbi:two component transcriptional regulator, LuxR family [Dyadobacter soli]|uniref:Two component transcriptional regulator, LuxR family n=2 Tax=Dyadobacter soli TaxID=659014 RepID=A0A1G8BUR6_9BACT|nr:two component transcriptional regulator, LuxR family [Dyadobacter soli]
MSQKIVLNELHRQATIMEADSFESGLSFLEIFSFDLILLDIDIPGGKGKFMIERIRQRQPNVVILICSAADEQIHALEYISVGANGYLSKAASKEDVIAALTIVVKNKRYVSLAVQERLLDAVSATHRTAKKLKAHELSGREQEVMQMLIKGKWVKEIASQLNLQSNTVSTYKARIFEKMGVTSIVELAKKAQQMGHA